MRKDTFQWLIPLLLAVGVALWLWVWWMFSQEPEKTTQPVAPVAEPAPAEPRSAQPEFPLREPPEMSADRPPLQPLPPLDQSDDYFKLELLDLFGERIGDLLVETRVIERIVATVDNLPREHVAQRIRPVGNIDGQFIVEETGENGDFVLSTENYKRYDALVARVAKTDASSIVELYRRFYPLLQKAYVDLGYPQGYFNDRLVEVIDDMLATPELSEPPKLARPHVLYTYADPELEKLSSGQKLLLRMGNENAKTIKDKLREIRSLITDLQ